MKSTSPATHRSRGSWARSRNHRRRPFPRSVGRDCPMSTLVFLEHHGDELLKGSLGVVTKAATVAGGDIAGVVLGSDVRALAEGAGNFGAAKVYVADDPQLEAPL